MEDPNINAVPITAPETFVVPAEGSFIPSQPQVQPEKSFHSARKCRIGGSACSSSRQRAFASAFDGCGLSGASCRTCFLGRFIFGLVAGAKEVTITYWGLWENDAMIRPILADFESSHPKIKVQYVKQSHRQYRERLSAAISRGEGPDVFRFHNTWVPMLRTSLLPAPKTVMTAAEYQQAFYPIATSDLVGGQSIYGIPLMIDGLGLYYNEDIFAAAGAKPPVTWEDVLNIVPKLTARNEKVITTSAIALGTTGNVEHFSDILATMMLQNGAKLSDPTGKTAEETLLFYRKFADPTDPVYTWNETLDNSIYAFAMGKVAMIFAPSWRAFDIKQMNANLRFKITVIPQLPGNTVTWASYWVEGVSAKVNIRPRRGEFVKYLTSKQTATKLYSEESKGRLFGEPYARVDMGKSLADDPYVGAFIKQAPNAKSFPLASRTFDNGLNDKLIKYLEDAVNGLAQGSAPKAVLDTASAGFRQVLKLRSFLKRCPSEMKRMRLSRDDAIFQPRRTRIFLITH